VIIDRSATSMLATILHMHYKEGTIMRHLIIGVAIVAIVLAGQVPSASALSFASSDATVDWAGMRFTTTGTLVLTSVTIGSVPTQHEAPPIVTKTTERGQASAHTDFSPSGYHSQSTAETISPDHSVNSARDFAELFSRGPFLSGHGVGTIEVTLPYFLTVTARADGPFAPGLNDVATASAGVALSAEAGGVFKYASDGLTWPDTSSTSSSGSLTKEGTLSLSVPVTNGAFFSIDTIATTNAYAARVPEPSSLWLSVVALIGLALWRYRPAHHKNQPIRQLP